MADHHDPIHGRVRPVGNLALGFWRPTPLTLGWFCICSVVGAVFVIVSAVQGRYEALAFLLVWTGAAGAFAVSEWRGLDDIRDASLEDRVGLTPPRRTNADNPPGFRP